MIENFNVETAAVEYVFGEEGYAVGDIEGGNLVAAGERVVSDACDAVGNVEGGKA